jgi:SNF2 family DNA or RNA helicase
MASRSILMGYYFKTAAMQKDFVALPHQDSARQAIDRSDGNLLLNWRVGSGKTPGSLLLTEHLRDKGQGERVLVLTPAALNRNYIDNGIKKFTKSPGTIIGPTSRGGVSPKNLKKKPGYYVVSNEYFRGHADEIIDKIRPDTLVIDEIHKYKSPTSKNYKEIMKVRGRFKNTIGLTGTPITNHPQDVVPMLDIVTNKQHNLGDWKDFKKTFTKKVYKRPTIIERVQGVKSKVEVVPKNTPRFRKEFNKYVHTYHTPPSSMPKKVIEDVEVPMSKEQEHIYNYALSKELSPIARAKIKYNVPMTTAEARHVFTAILQARQASNSMHLFDKRITPEMSADLTPKTRKVLDDVEDHLKTKNTKAIIYSNLHKGSLDAIQAGLTKRKIPHSLFLGTGHIKPKDRQQGVDEYLKGKKRVILVNQAGTEGLNLPGTTGHFAVDGHFNPAVIEQAEARGIRTGSPVAEVKVRRYKSTIPRHWYHKLLRNTPQGTDEWVYNIAKRKDDFNKQFMPEDT